MKASSLISQLQNMIDKYGDIEVEAYDNTVLPVKVKRVVYKNASDWKQSKDEKVFRICCK